MPADDMPLRVPSISNGLMSGEPSDPYYDSFFTSIDITRFAKGFDLTGIFRWLFGD